MRYVNPEEAYPIDGIYESLSGDSRQWVDDMAAFLVEEVRNLNNENLRRSGTSNFGPESARHLLLKFVAQGRYVPQVWRDAEAKAD
jgi:hypothetical protein